LLNQGRPAEALEPIQRALAIAPDDPLAAYNAGLAYHTLKEYALAEDLYLNAIEQLPGFTQALHNLAQLYSAMGKLSQAIAAYRKSLQTDPEDFKSAYNLGLLCREQGLTLQAVDALRTAIQANPNSADAFCMLGLIYLEQNHFNKALVCLEQALCINPRLAQALYNKGIVLQKTGNFEHSIDLFRQAESCNPDFAPARWLRLLSLPMIYDAPEQIDRYRLRFRDNLDRLIASVALKTKAQQSFALQGVQTMTNFYLQYQCRNDLVLQQKYGRFVHDVMAANFPQWATAKAMPSMRPGGKIRIGYVSTFMYDHTIGTFLSGWLESHTQSDFEIHSYHVGDKVDDLTHRLRSLSHKFYHFGDNMTATARQIEADNLHILVYSDIGMDAVTTLLAALRLAPVQCKGWGHPVTTGLPTMDYYLSSDLMEPDHAQSFYSETLVRLPNLALYYRPPKFPDKPKSRHDIGLPEDRFIYLSTQSIFKYLPQHDDIYPRIAKAVPQAYFVFLSHQSEFATARFQERLRAVFAARGLNADQFCCFSRRLNFSDFLSLNLGADVLLDSFEWSGGKTTLEAVSCGLPVVTLPGRFMRGRHAYAMLRMINVTETIADNKTAYCDIAIRLARDSDFLTRIRADIAGNRHKLYQDHSFMTALEDFYHSIVSQHLASKHVGVGHG